MQWLGAALDSFLAIASYELCLSQSPVGSNTYGRGPTIWGTVLIVSRSNAHHLYWTYPIQDNGRPLVGDRCCRLFREVRISSLASATRVIIQYALPPFSALAVYSVLCFACVRGSLCKLKIFDTQ